MEENKYCLNCGKKLIYSQHKYCSGSCQQNYQAKLKIQAWQNGEFNGMSGKYGLSKIIRNYMLKKSNYSCELCGWNKINLTTGKSPLEIHHKDGDYRNNKEENLQVLCPNCHSLTSTYKALNKEGREDRESLPGRKEYNKEIIQNYCIDCGVPISKDSTRCRHCANKNKITEKPITREELKERIRVEPFVKIAKDFNVSDKTISKWCARYGLPATKREIKLYTNEQWEQL